MEKAAMVKFHADDIMRKCTKLYLALWQYIFGMEKKKSI